MKTKTKVIIAISVIFSALIIATAITLPILLHNKNDGDDNSNSVNQFIMHRGGDHNDCADNTMEAFEYATTTNCYGIETDIWRTADGYFVCSHDEAISLDGVSGAVNIPNEHYETIKNYNIQNTGAPIVLMDDYLKTCKKGNKIAVIELKCSLDDSGARALMDMIDECYSRDKVCIMSFDIVTLDRCRKIDDSIDYYLWGWKNTGIFDTAVTYNYNVGYMWTGITEEHVKIAHDAGFKVMIGPLNDSDKIAQLLSMGVDFIVTDTYF